jgi:hypothetical protein
MMLSLEDTIAEAFRVEVSGADSAEADRLSQHA